MLPTSYRSDINNKSEDYKDRAEIIEEFLSEYEGRTKESYTDIIQAFFNFTTSKKIDRLTRKHMLSYKMDLIARELAPNTINTYLSVMRKFTEWCTERTYLDSNPAMYLKNVKVKKVNQARSLSDQEISDLFAQTNDDDLRALTERMYLLLIFNLGLRVSEVMSIKISDLFLNQEKPQITITGKGDKQRILGINATLQDNLFYFLGRWDNILKQDDYLIQGNFYRTHETSSKPTSREYGRLVFKRYATAAGINLEGIKTHSGRVTAINKLMDIDVNLRDVANFAGHASINTTKRYDRKDADKVIETSNLISFGN